MMSAKTLNNRMSFILCLIVSALVWPATAQQEAAPGEIKFRHSPKGLHALLGYNKKLESLAAVYEKTLKDVDERFVRTSLVQVNRYTARMDRESRALTRNSQFDQARAALDMIKTVKALKITPPDADGAHFLSLTQLEVEGSETATQHGLDFLLQIEATAVAHRKQHEAAFTKYHKEVTEARAGLSAELTKVLDFEMRSGRLDAMDEVKAALELLKQPVNLKPKTPGSTGQGTSTRQDDQDKAGGKIDLFPDVDGKKKGDVPSWAGYYLLQYDKPFGKPMEYVVRLDKTGSRLVYINLNGTHNKRDAVTTPIQLAIQDKNTMLLKHEASGFKGDDRVHKLKVDDGTLTSAELWTSETAFKQSDAPDHNGRIVRLGSPGANLLGLPDGVYRSRMTQTMSRQFRPENKTIQFEVTIDNGHVLVTRSNYSADDNKWSVPYSFVLVVETQGSELVMHYDQNEFGWPDCFVIDVSDKQKPLLKHWWRKDWRPRGDGPSAVGVLERVSQ